MAVSEQRALHSAHRHFDFYLVKEAVGLFCSCLMELWANPIVLEYSQQARMSSGKNRLLSRSTLITSGLTVAFTKIL